MPTATCARLLLGLLAALVIAGCGRNLEMSGVHTAITEGLSAQAGLAVDSIACPESHPMRAGDVFECVATPNGGGRLTIAITQTDDQGHITWKVAKTEGLLDLSKIEASVRVGLKEQARVNATVSCGGRWKAAKAGDSFECAAKTGTKPLATIVVKVVDNEGRIDWTTK